MEVLLGFMSGWVLLVPRPPGSRSQSPNFTTCCKQLVFIFWPHVGSSFPNQGSNPHPLYWKLSVITGPPGKFPQALSLNQTLNGHKQTRGAGLPLFLVLPPSSATRPRACGNQWHQQSWCVFTFAQGVGWGVCAVRPSGRNVGSKVGQTPIQIVPLLLTAL